MSGGVVDSAVNPRFVMTSRGRVESPTSSG